MNEFWYQLSFANIHSAQIIRVSEQSIFAFVLFFCMQDENVLLNKKPVQLKAKGRGILQVSVEALFNVDKETTLQGFDVEVM